MACFVHQSLLEHYRTHVEALNNAAGCVSEGKDLPEGEFTPLWKIAETAAEKCSNAYRALTNHIEQHGC